ncbi:hypothetical protein Q9R20_08490 [Microbacterium sp. PRF11]|jgi:hypothetical protein|uniref:hypothetical protein n=1 Tax=Microbacterium sp. PRF11 TaxID=2962593 RepID=UPI002881D3CE|nr:hypothetical protein [Microbacterium sp. PRF11]MDT0117030.1 hypothetical protein [Microbacterium sp. PRF11]
MSDDDDFPPRRTRERLQGWVDDFLAEDGDSGHRIDVMPQEGERDLDTGLVVMRPRHSEMPIYIQPRAYDDPLWEMTLPARDEEVTMSPLELGRLAALVVAAVNLCTYLQFRSLEWDRQSGRRGD